MRRALRLWGPGLGSKLINYAVRQNREEASVQRKKVTLPLFGPHQIEIRFKPDTEVVVAEGDCLDTLRTLPDCLFGLVITSPPYNLGKIYEKPKALGQYIDSLRPVIHELARVLSPHGSLCWQVGNYVEKGEVFLAPT